MGVILVFRMNKVPYIKFICRTVSHFFFLLLLILTACIPIDKIQDRTTFIPQWYEWMLLSKSSNERKALIVRYFLVWVSGLLLTELTTVGERTGVGLLK